MCFEDRRRRNRVELVCECREVRSDRDNRRRWDRRREDDFRCHCRECNRRGSNWGW